ncbi:ANKRD11 [Symbiodinium natans]|uniref:ANKRD11 protein n=1 Tax=Symbiodinium natans TaxID=878477 RepID=A0A812JBX9_9DINO|nr:ANKRD11 [Symbiodinium natans]
MPTAPDATNVLGEVEAGRYRFDKLFILMERSFEDLLVVSKLCASVAPEIMHDKGKNRVHPEWTEALVKQAETDLVSSTRHWMEIMHWSDGAGEVILDVLTVRPEAQNSNYNPIPRRARLPSGVQMVCRYESARTWEWDQETGAAPWHSLLCPGGLSIYAKRGTFSKRARMLESLLWWRQRRGNQLFGSQNVSNMLNAPARAFDFQPEASIVRDKESVPVKVRQLKLPGIVNPDVMHILAYTQNHNILLKPTGQAIIQYAWDHVARYYYWTYVFYQVITLGNLVVEVVSPADTFWGRRLRWSLLAVLAHLELFYEFWEMAGYLCYLQHAGPRYLTKLENLYNWVSIILLMVLVWWTSSDVTLQEIPIMLSVLVLFRWIQLTWSCRAFEYVGEKILPILQASFSTSIGGILVVTFCVLVGFVHGALALELGHELPQHYKVVLGALKLLLLGDGDGIDVALTVGGAPEEGTPLTFVFLLTAMVVFCVCVLNLFIAVHGEAYSRAQDKAYTSFLQERAGICLHCLLRPSWPPHCIPIRVPHRILSYLSLELVAIAAWALMLQEPSIHYLIPTGLLCGSAMLGDSILVQRPWNKTKGEQYYLWMCYKESLDKSTNVPDSADMYNALEKEVRLVSKQFERQTRSFADQVQGLKERLQGLESSVEKLADTAEYVSGRRGWPTIME